MKTGVIGLGAMGQGMARNLANAGLLAAVWNRSPEKAEALAAELHVPAVNNPVELADACEAIVICVSADADVLAMITALQPALSANHLVIDCSTVSRETANQAEKHCGAAGAGFMDCPVSGGVEGAQNGTLAIMCGGSAADFERAAPVLNAMGQRLALMGPVGAGQATKAVNQVLCAGINQAVCEAMHFAAAHDLPLDKVIDVVGSGAAGNWFLNNRGPNMIRGNYPYGFKLSLHHKDLKICEAMASHAGVDVPLAKQTRETYETLMAAGHADEDISALYRQFS